MKEFFANMDTVESIYWYIAIGTSLVFIILTIISFVGAGDTDMDMDIDADVDSVESPIHIFTFRNAMNFLLGFGWTGVAFYDGISNHLVLGLIAIAIGFVFVGIFTFIAKSFFKLAENNAFKVEGAIGKTADVYLRIPAARSGKGKVQVSINGSIHEIEAVTEDEEVIDSGKSVKVLNIEGTSTLIVTAK